MNYNRTLLTIASTSSQSGRGLSGHHDLGISAAAANVTRTAGANWWTDSKVFSIYTFIPELDMHTIASTLSQRARGVRHCGHVDTNLTLAASAAHTSGVASAN